MITAVDTNVLLDAFTGTLAEVDRAVDALSRSIHAGSLITSTICYAELARRFPQRKILDDLLLDIDCTVVDLDTDTAFLAGRFFDEYRGRGGDKSRILADFLIAANATIHADRILTQDKRFFGNQFLGLSAITCDDV